MKDLNPQKQNFKVANYNFCQHRGILDKMRVLFPHDKKEEALLFVKKFPKYCKIVIHQTTTNNYEGFPCWGVFGYWEKNTNKVTGEINEAAIKREKKIKQILNENGIKSF